jgi:type III restriction enzyme
VGVRPIKALLDPYNTTGSTKYVRFNTSRSERWDTNGPPPKNHVNWVVLDSDWEAEFCRVAESHPKVIAYTKNRNLGLEVPYRFGSETRRYLPDFIVLVDDGHSLNDPLHLVVEIKGYRREDAKENKSAMDTYWVPGVNHLGNYGRWAFAEFIEIYQIESDFAAKVASAFNEMLESVPEVRPLWIEESLNRSNEYISRHFGDDPALVRLNQAIWSSIGSNKDRAFRLSDLNSAEADSNETEEMLAILTLLSNPSIRLLKIQLRSDTGTELNTQEFTRKLTDWWRKKQIANEEWQRWATNIAVSWVAVESAVHNR